MNLRTRHVEILAWSFFLGIVQFFRKLRDILLSQFQETLQRFQWFAVGRTLAISIFGLLLGILAGYLVAWIVINNG